MGNTTTNSMFLNNRSSIGNKTRGSGEDVSAANNTAYGNIGGNGGFGLNNSNSSNPKIASQKEVKLPQIR